MESNNNSQICLYQKNNPVSVEIVQTKDFRNDQTIRSYKKRFWMLLLFSTLSMLCGMAFPQYASMTDVTMCFYGVSAEAVNWTCLIFMVVYVILVFPVSWLMSKMGLKFAIIIGSVFNTLGYAVEFAILSPDNYSYVIVSSFFGSLSNVLVLAIPPCLAAVWFPHNEVSRACAVGVFGNQLGVALGFVIPPSLISVDCSNKDLIAQGKRNLAIILTSANAIVLLLIVLTFKNKPEFPPSIAQAEKKDVEESFLKTALSMAKNINFILIFIMYGLVVGTYFALATLMNQLILSFFPAAGVIVGWMGLLLISSGLIGSVIAGYILDYTHKFKQTTVSICALSFIFYVVFSCLLQINQIWLQFVSIGILGFFLTSFLPVGFEYGIEVTYPQSEITSASLLNSATMIFGIVVTEIASNVLEAKGPNYANGVLCAALLAATIISIFITKNYKRSKKNKEVVSIT